jgi:hypothetical protein
MRNNVAKIARPPVIGLLALALALVFLPAASPNPQDSGVQGTIWTGEVVTTTAKTAVVACGQGDGAIGRKTLVVRNDDGSDGVITVTAELRDNSAGPNFTSGYLAANGVATDTLGSDTAVATDAAGAFCEISAVSASTSTITVTLRRE